MKILIADDEAPIRDWFAYVLTQKVPGLKAQVETAAGGLEALEKMEKDPPDVVFADIKMPGLDGIEVLRRLRALALTESTHSLQSELNFGLGSSDSKGLREFLELHSINWLASSTVPASQRVTVPAFISPYA